MTCLGLPLVQLDQGRGETRSLGKLETRWGEPRPELAPDLLEDPQVIAAQDLQDVLVGVAALDQAQRQVRQLGHGLEAGWGALDAEEVRTQPDVIDANRP